MKNILKLASFLFGFIAYTAIAMYNKDQIQYDNAFWAGVGTCFVYCLLIEED